MTYLDPPTNPPSNGSEATSPPYWSFEDVQARLIEAVQLWWRVEGGRWPFASDGPWHLIRKEWEDWDARDPKPLRSLPLTRDQVAQRDEATGWLSLVGDRDRRLVVIVLAQLAADRKPAWTKIWDGFGRGRPGPDGLRRRYDRAIAGIAVQLSR